MSIAPQTIKKSRIYGRFSSKPQEKGDSYRRQTGDEVKAYAARNNLEIIGEPYFDEGVSGKAGLNLEKEFGRYLNEAQAGEALLVEITDRIGRQNPILLCKLLYDTVHKGIEIHFWAENRIINADNLNQMGTSLPMFVSAATGHEDNERKIFRVRLSVKTTIESCANGKLVKGALRFTPQCFKWDNVNEKVYVDEIMADTVRFIFAEYNKGIGTTRIASVLNESKKPTFYKIENGKDKKTGNKKKPAIWHGNTVKYVLNCPCFNGVLTINGSKFNILPKVVSDAVFNKAQMFLERNTTNKGNLRGRTNNIFGRITHCKHCGGRVKAVIAGKHSYMYCCTNSLIKGCKHKNKMLNAKYVELGFFRKFIGIRSSSLLKGDNREVALKEQIEGCKAKLGTLETRIGNLYDLVERGDKEAEKRINERKVEKADTESQIKVLQAKLNEAGQMDSQYQTITRLLSGVARFDNGKVSNRAEVLSKVYEFPQPLSIMEVLKDTDTRKKMSLIIPTLFSKLVFDCQKNEIEVFDKAEKMIGVYSPRDIQDKLKEAKNTKTPKYKLEFDNSGIMEDKIISIVESSPVIRQAAMVK